MLILSRKPEEEVHIFVAGEKITVRVCEVAGSKVKLGFDAPRSCVILRKEVAEIAGGAELLKSL